MVLKLRRTGICRVSVCFIGIVMLVACSKDKEGSPEPAPPTPSDCKTGLTAGANFLAVKSVLAANCVSCHGGSSPRAGINFADDCTIVSKAARIKVRAVDVGDMPPGGPLSSADKPKITDWINAGGKYNN